MVDMVKRDIYPAVCAFMKEVAGTIAAKKAALPDIDCTAEEKLLRTLTGYSASLMEACEALENAIGQVPSGSLAEEAHYYRYTVFAIMEKVRAAADALEVITSSKFWPYPSYAEILFSIK